MQVTDFDVAVAAQEEPVPSTTAVFSFAHMAPELITDKQLTKVTHKFQRKTQAGRSLHCAQWLVTCSAKHSSDLPR